MSKMLRTVSSLGIAAAISLSPAVAFADQPLGVYQTTDRKMDYTLSLCGKDEKQLCVVLTGIRGTADIPRTRAFLNKYVVDHGKPAGKNKWKGSISVSGYTANGTLTLHPGVNFVMHGCVYVVACQDFTLIPAQ